MSVRIIQKECHIRISVFTQSCILYKDQEKKWEVGSGYKPKDFQTSLQSNKYFLIGYLIEASQIFGSIMIVFK